MVYLYICMCVYTYIYIYTYTYIYIYIYIHLYIFSICVSVYIHLHIDTGSNTNRRILDFGLEGLPFLILMIMAEEDFLWPYKVLWLRLKCVAMQSQVLMFSEQSLEREKCRDIEKYILSTTYEP